MPPRLSWRKLLPGILALGAVVATALAVLLFAGIGQIRGEKKHVFFLSDQARGVMHGTEVWLAGQKIGLVDRVEFRAPSNDVSGRVIIAATVRVVTSPVRIPGRSGTSTRYPARASARAR